MFRVIMEKTVWGGGSSSYTIQTPIPGGGGYTSIAPMPTTVPGNSPTPSITTQSAVVEDEELALMAIDQAKAHGFHNCFYFRIKHDKS